MITGAVGAWVSMVTTNAEERLLTFPARFVAVAVKVYLPSGKLWLLYCQFPLLSAAVVPTSWLFSYTDTVLLASAVPSKVGSFMLVTPSVELVWCRA